MKYKTAQIIGAIAIGAAFSLAPKWGPLALRAGQPATKSHASPGVIPAEITQLMEHAGEILNQHHPDQFPAITTPEAHLTEGWAAKINTKWAADGIAVPHNEGEAPSYLAVFHTWHTCEADADHIYKLEHTPEGWKIGAEIPETDTGGLRIRDHDLTVSTDVAQKMVDITDKVKLERSGNGASFGLMRLSEDFTVSKITLEGGPDAAVPYTEAGGVVAFLPPAGNSFTLSMRYAGTVDHADGDFLHRDEVTLSSYWYPVIVGSSRVDLQACKLEYSIVSPK